MTAYSARLKNGTTVHYVDRKRWLWGLSVLFPLQPFVGIALHAWTGQQAWLLFPLFLSYVVMPLLDALIGQDINNPPEAVVSQLEADAWYRRLTYLVVPMHVIALLGACWWASSQPLAAWAFAGLAAVTGFTSGFAINTGHELGHKRSRLEQTLAKVSLAVPAYGHFTVEHNQGHHSDVATPGDPASARMGESVYRFALREMPGAFLGAIRRETGRLRRSGKAAWGPGNRVLHGIALTLALQGSIVVVFGIEMIPFLLLHNVCAWWMLSSANYIEHYGLLRQAGENGRPERCQPHHSWNCNFLLSNLALFHLQRHSDHHTHPQRRYQALRHFDDLPTLPNGYFGCYLLAWLPWLWFRVMDPKLMALPHVQGNLERVNVDPARRAAIERRYGESGRSQTP